MKLFSNEDEQNTTQKSPGRNEFIIIKKIAIESPQKMSDRDLEEVVDVWNRKPRRIVV